MSSHALQPAGTSRHASLESLPLPVVIPKVPKRTIIWDAIWYLIIMPCIIGPIIIGTFLTCLVLGRMVYLKTGWAGSSPRGGVGNGDIVAATLAGLLFTPIFNLWFLPARWKVVEMFRELVGPSGRHIVSAGIIFFILGFPCAAIAGAICGLKWEGMNAAVNTLSYCIGMSMCVAPVFLGFLLITGC